GCAGQWFHSYRNVVGSICREAHRSRAQDSVVLLAAVRGPDILRRHPFRASRREPVSAVDTAGPRAPHSLSVHGCVRRACSALLRAVVYARKSRTRIERGLKPATTGLTIM